MSTGFLLDDEALTLSVTNDSGTTAITAGDIVASIACDDKFGSTTTETSVKSLYAAGDVRVKAAKWANTYYRTPMGVAITDIAADGTGTIALEGLFFHQAQENLEAGSALQFYEGTANKLGINDSGTTAAYSESHTKIGRALTGGSADTKYILWKLTL